MKTRKRRGSSFSQLGLEPNHTGLEPNGTSLCMEELGDEFSFVFVVLVFLDVV